MTVTPAKISAAEFGSRQVRCGATRYFASICRPSGRTRSKNTFKLLQRAKRIYSRNRHPGGTRLRRQEIQHDLAKFLRRLLEHRMGGARDHRDPLTWLTSVCVSVEA